MDYGNMSDFEINKAVTESLGMNAREKSSCVNHSEGESVVSVVFGGCMRAFDPCNNPSDAWPLLLTLVNNGCTVIIDKESINGDKSAKTIERKIAELYLSVGTD